MAVRPNTKPMGAGASPAPARSHRGRPRVHQRVCLYCGFSGEAVQPGPSQVFTCPRCLGDLYARPVRSYAEMEGLELAAPQRVGFAGFARRVALVAVTAIGLAALLVAMVPQRAVARFRGRAQRRAVVPTRAASGPRLRSTA